MQDISFLGLIAGAMDEMQIDEIIDSLLPKVGQHFVTHGQLVRLAILRLLAGHNPKGFNNIRDFARSIPAAVLLGVDPEQDLDPNQLNEFALGRTMDEIFSFGAADFSMQVLTHAFSRMGDPCKVECLHIDSTSMCVCTTPYTEEQIAKLSQDHRVLAIADKPNKAPLDKTAPFVLRGYCRDTNPRYPQYNLIHVVTQGTELLPPLPVLSITYSGNINDLRSFANSADQFFPQLKAAFTGLKYIIADSAGASFKNVHNLHRIGLYVITRLPDNRVRTVIEQARAGYLKFEPFELNGKECEAAWVDEPYVFSGLVDKSNNVVDATEALKLPEDATSKELIPAKQLVVKAYNMRKTKTETLNKRAKNELKKFNKAKAKMNKNPFQCRPDAETAVAALIESSKYCKFGEVSYDEKKCFKRRGAPAANDEYTLEVRPKFDVDLDQEKIAAAINSELFYVLAVTDTQKDWSAKKLVEIYHEQSHVERTWRDIKDTEFFTNALLVKNPCRARALLTIVSIALFVMRIVVHKIHSFIEATQQRLPVGGGSRTSGKRPSWKTITAYFRNIGYRLYIDEHNGSCYVQPYREDGVIDRILEFVGPEWSKYYDAAIYRPHAVNMVLRRMERDRYLAARARKGM